MATFLPRVHPILAVSMKKMTYNVGICIDFRNICCIFLWWRLILKMMWGIQKCKRHFLIQRNGSLREAIQKRTSNLEEEKANSNLRKKTGQRPSWKPNNKRIILVPLGTPHLLSEQRIKPKGALVSNIRHGRWKGNTP